MSKKDLISRINSYYEELSTLNKEIERLLKESSPEPEKISNLLNRKDYIMEQCLRIKGLLESGNFTEELNESDELPEKVSLLNDVMKQEKLNQELAKKSLFRLKEELKDIKTNKKKVKYYKNPEKKYGKLNKKV